MITKQEIFNKVWNHFVVNKGEPSVSNGQCLYRKNRTADDPCRCAVGLLIPDEQYNPAMDVLGIGVFGLTNQGLIGLHGKGFEETAAMFNAEGSILSALQGAHDNATKHEQFHTRLETRLRDIAEDYVLEVPA